MKQTLHTLYYVTAKPLLWSFRILHIRDAFLWKAAVNELETKALTSGTRPQQSIISAFVSSVAFPGNSKKLQVTGDHAFSPSCSGSRSCSDFPLHVSLELFVHNVVAVWPPVGIKYSALLQSIRHSSHFGWKWCCSHSCKVLSSVPLASIDCWITYLKYLFGISWTTVRWHDWSQTCRYEVWMRASLNYEKFSVLLPNKHHRVFSCHITAAGNKTFPMLAVVHFYPCFHSINCSMNTAIWWTERHQWKKWAYLSLWVAVREMYCCAWRSNIHG